MASKKEKFIIIDGNALLHRAFHAVPPLTTTDGRLVNAVYGFVTILLRVMKELKPRYVATTFDLKTPTFRHAQYEEYKATRVKQPDELYEQLDPIKKIVRAFNIPIYEVAGYEADDLIGTVSKKLDANKEIDTYIVTGDLDTLQLVDDNTFVYTLKRSIADTIVYDERAVKEKYQGLRPDQLIDFKALRGDPSDNIPGVRGIGEKIAIELLTEYKTLENLYKKYEKSRKISPRIKSLLKEYEKDAILSKKLATIVTEVPIKFKMSDNEFTGVDRKKVIELFQDLEFKSLLGKIPDLEEVLKVHYQADGTKVKAKGHREKVDYILIKDQQSFAKFYKKLSSQKIFALDTETSDLDPWRAEMVGLSFAWEAGQAYYLDWKYLRADRLARDKLSKILAANKINKVGHNIKFDVEALLTSGIRVAGIYFDTMVAAYLLNPGERQLKLDNLVFSEFGHQMIPIEDLIGKKGKGQLSMKELAAEEIFYYACEDADYTWRLYEVMQRNIKQADLNDLFFEMEMPLIKILIEMEKNGIKLDEKFLATLNKAVAQEITALEKKIYRSADCEFNISSPKQLKEILFAKLDIPIEGLRKTKTGISTAASELEKMRGLHPIIDFISDYRELTKLQSTYIEALPKLINPQTGRVHTSFNQTITATGRLSSSDPNLQNIPIRTELGRKIRQAFVAEPGNVLLTADYSQIELRVTAHLSEDRNMIDTFKKKLDIHIATAAFIYDLPLEKVTADQRRKAKEVNFGVLYGMGAFGLAERTGISRTQAQEFIDKYFNQYPQMKKYRQQVLAQAAQTGRVETLFKRRRYLPELNSQIALIRQAAERAAINLPVQGTSADIMKLAMIAVQEKIISRQSDVKLLLQVHDELVLEVPQNKLVIVGQSLKNEMEQVTKLKVPLVVEIKAGRNWRQLKEI